MEVIQSNNLAVDDPSTQINIAATQDYRQNHENLPRSFHSSKNSEGEGYFALLPPPPSLPRKPPRTSHGNSTPTYSLFPKRNPPQLRIPNIPNIPTSPPPPSAAQELPEPDSAYHLRPSTSPSPTFARPRALDRSPASPSLLNLHSPTSPCFPTKIPFCLNSQYQLVPVVKMHEQYEYQRSRITEVQEREHHRDFPAYFNIVICGDAGVGKTALIQNFCRHTLTNRNPHSVHWTKMEPINDTQCAFHLIETWTSAVLPSTSGTLNPHHAHMGRYRTMDSPDALILVYDPSVPQSLASLSAIHETLIVSKNLQSKVPVTIIANKTDLLPSTPTTATIGSVSSPSNTTSTSTSTSPVSLSPQTPSSSISSDPHNHLQPRAAGYGAQRKESHHSHPTLQPGRAFAASIKSSFFALHSSDSPTIRDVFLTALREPATHRLAAADHDTAARDARIEDAIGRLANGTVTHRNVISKAVRRFMGKVRRHGYGGGDEDGGGGGAGDEDGGGGGRRYHFRSRSHGRGRGGSQSNDGDTHGSSTGGGGSGAGAGLGMATLGAAGSRIDISGFGSTSAFHDTSGGGDQSGSTAHGMMMMRSKHRRFHSQQNVHHHCQPSATYSTVGIENADGGIEGAEATATSITVGGTRALGVVRGETFPVEGVSKAVAAGPGVRSLWSRDSGAGNGNGSGGKKSRPSSASAKLMSWPRRSGLSGLRRRNTVDDKSAGGNMVGAGLGGGIAGVAITRLPVRSPTVDMTWNEWIIGGDSSTPNSRRPSVSVGVRRGSAVGGGVEEAVRKMSFPGFGREKSSLMSGGGEGV